MEVVFSDKSMTFDVFVEALANRLAPILQQRMEKPQRDVLSQRAAYRKYGSTNVKRWIKTCRLEPFSKRPGKIEYKVEDLERLYNNQQDYLYT